MCKIVTVKKAANVWENPSVVYEIPLSNGRNVYMRADRTNHRNAERFVVIVDAAKFLQLWRDDPYEYHADVAFQSPATWPNDRKYKSAEQGFSHGIDNPVPLAEVSLEVANRQKEIREKSLFIFTRLVRVEQQSVPYVAFTNGITRTIWLLTNGAGSFPVEVDANQADLMQQHCGIIGSPTSVEALTA